MPFAIAELYTDTLLSLFGIKILIILAPDIREKVMHVLREDGPEKCVLDGAHRPPIGFADPAVKKDPESWQMPNPVRQVRRPAVHHRDVADKHVAAFAHHWPREILRDVFAAGGTAHGHYPDRCGLLLLSLIHI